MLNGRVEQELLLGRLKYVEAGYHQRFRCMEGTRKALLKEIMDWANNIPSREDGFQTNIFWLYELPGIGKTALAHSICAMLQDHEQLAGSFFCRRDDANLSEPGNILPSLIGKLAGNIPPFRTIVANRLRSDSNLTPDSMKDSLFLDFIHPVPRHPKHPLVFVIDALDECGNTRSRPSILNVIEEIRRIIERLFGAGQEGRRLNRFINRQTSLSLTWVAGHVGSVGNEAADELAKVATEFGSSDEDLLPDFLKGTLPSSVAASKQHVKRITGISTEKWWKRSKCYKRIRAVDPTLPSKTYITATGNLSRAQTSVLTQLRTGHAPLNQHLHVRSVSGPEGWVEAGGGTD